MHQNRGEIQQGLEQLTVLCLDLIKDIHIDKYCKMVRRGYHVFVLAWCMVILTLLLLLLRLYARRLLLNRSSRRRLIIATEIFVVFAWISFAFDVIIEQQLWLEGFFDISAFTYHGLSDDTTILGLRIWYIQGLTYFNCLYAVKAAILCTYFQLFPKDATRSKTWLWFTCGCVSIAFFSQLLLVLLWCKPISRNWNPNPDIFCSPQSSSLVWFVTVIGHMATDVLLYALPLPLLRHIVLSNGVSLREKIKLGITFSVGFLCILFAIAVTIFTQMDSPNPYLVFPLIVMEQCYAVIVICCPPCFNVFCCGNGMRTFRRNCEISEVVEIDVGRSAEMERLASNDLIVAVSGELNIEGSKTSVSHTELEMGHHLV